MQTRYHAHDCELRNSLVYDEYHIYDYYRVNGLVTPLKAARAENPVHSFDQQSCSPCRPAVMIIGYVPAVHVPADHTANGMAAAVPA